MIQSNSSAISLTNKDNAFLIQNFLPKITVISQCMQVAGAVDSEINIINTLINAVLNGTKTSEDAYLEAVRLNESRNSYYH